ncbi:MAG: hypothetical protein RLZ98_1768 [Pseudomonadota bacterium]
MNAPLISTFRQGAGHLGAVERVAGWVRARFALPAEAVVLVSEVSCQLPGCPPVETMVVIWTDADTRYRTKFFKPVAEVTEEDLPPKWYLPALYDDGTIWCSCC